MCAAIAGLGCPQRIELNPEDGGDYSDATTAPPTDASAPDSSDAGCPLSCGTFAADASQRDRDSHRQVLGHCDGPAFVSERPCELGESCDPKSPACTTCGRFARQAARSAVDGGVSQDCAGCCADCGPYKCGWYVLGCFNETANYGAPWVDLVRQEGSDVLRFVATNTGVLKATGYRPGVDAVKSTRLTVQAMDLVKGGEVELEVEVAMDRGAEHWDLHAHVVANCP